MKGMVIPTCKQSMWPKAHDFKCLKISNDKQHESEIIKLYEKGLSLRDIGARIGFSKTKVRDILLRARIPLRSFVNESRRATDGTRATILSKAKMIRSSFTESDESSDESLIKELRIFRTCSARFM
jgi:hypothetical protein